MPTATDTGYGSGPRALGGGWAIPVVVKITAYTLVPQDCGKLFINTGGSGGTTYTLPATSAVHNGWWAEFATTAADVITIASAPADTLIVHGDATADTIASAATIGQHFKVVSCGATGMFVVSDPSLGSTVTNDVSPVVIVTN